MKCEHCHQDATVLIDSLCAVCAYAYKFKMPGPYNTLWFGRATKGYGENNGRKTGDVEIYWYNDELVTFAVRLWGCCYRLPKNWLVAYTGSENDDLLHVRHAFRPPEHH
jgi:hypothetical protein